MKKRTALLRKLKTVFGRYVSQPVRRVIEEINPILRGWVNYFTVGHSSRCFSVIKLEVEKKIRRQLMRARRRQVPASALALPPHWHPGDRRSRTAAVFCS